MPRKNSKQKRRKNTLAMFNDVQLEKEVKKIAKKTAESVVKKKVELMYKLESSFTNLMDETATIDGDEYHLYYFEDHKVILVPLDIDISRGSSADQFNGNNINVKALSQFIRYRPASQYVSLDQIVTGDGTAEDPYVKEAPDYDFNPFPQHPEVRIFVFRMDRDAWEANYGTKTNPTVADIAQRGLFAGRLHTKFKPLGSWTQDYLQSGGQEFIKSIKPISKTTLKPKYRTQSYTWLAQDRLSGTFTDGSGAISLSPDSSSDQRTLQTTNTLFSGYVGQTSVTHLQSRIDDELLFEMKADDQPSEPINYQYAMYVQFANRYIDHEWDPLDDPKEFSLRSMWTWSDL